jgi:hypothetical protein
MFRKLQSQLEAPLFDEVRRGIACRKHVLRFAEDGRSQVSFLRLHVIGTVNQQRGELVGLASWYLYIPSVRHFRAPRPNWNDVKQVPLCFIVVAQPVPM